ncbi:hypothetical protein IG631_07231 [Alternaria alternata]|nr:hypothetical protein IG631_07231 [Alternaria alternata]
MQKALSCGIPPRTTMHEVKRLSTESESEHVQGLGTTVPRLGRLVARPIGAN